MEKNKKKSKGCLMVVIVLVLLTCIGLFFTGRYMKGIATYLSSEDKFLQDRLETLPVLETDDEISKAINDEPQNYLVKNYVFKKSPTIKDTVFNVLNGNYLCIDIVEETLTYYRKNVVKAGQTPYYSIWEEKPYCQISAPLCFNNGVEILNHDSLTFLFSLLKRSERIFLSEINPEKKENFSIDSRYYPDRQVNISDPEKVVKDIFDKFGDNVEELTKHFGDNGLKFDTRYNLTYMSTDDKATFAVRLGNGRADFKVFDDKNILVVGGDRITTSTQEAVFGTVWTIMGNVLMILAVVIVLIAIIALVFNIKK
jgi:hypothetical protein